MKSITRGHEFLKSCFYQMVAQPTESHQSIYHQAISHQFLLKNIHVKLISSIVSFKKHFSQIRDQKILYVNVYAQQQRNCAIGIAVWPQIAHRVTQNVTRSPQRAKKIFDLYQQRAATAHLTVYIAIRYEDVMYVGMYFTSMYARMSDKLRVQWHTSRRRAAADCVRPAYFSTVPFYCPRTRRTAAQRRSTYRWSSGSLRVSEFL